MRKFDTILTLCLHEGMIMCHIEAERRTVNFAYGEGNAEELFNKVVEEYKALGFRYRNLDNELVVPMPPNVIALSGTMTEIVAATFPWKDSAHGLFGYIFGGRMITQNTRDEFECTP